MSTKTENEITVKVTCSKAELIKILEDQGFTKTTTFSLDDYYFVPTSLDLKQLTTREILAQAVIVRYIVDPGKISQKITFKRKDIDASGNILSQDSINCEVSDIADAKKLFEALGYSEIMNIKEKDEVYSKNNFELALKFVENSDILIEIETISGTKWDTIEKIKTALQDLNLPIEKDQYFVKKAENELNKILKR